jgi:hypothetical protein
MITLAVGRDARHSGLFEYHEQFHTEVVTFVTSCLAGPHRRAVCSNPAIARTPLVNAP